MLKNFIKGFVVAGIIVTVHFSLPASSAQHTADRFPQSFFLGKWGGYISGAIVIDGAVFPFAIDLKGFPAQLAVGPYGGGASFRMIMQGSWPCEFSFSEINQCGVISTDDSPLLFVMTYPPDAPGFIVYQMIFNMAGFTTQVEDENLISLASGGVDPDLWESSYAFGELRNIYVLSDTLGKTIEINEPVETDAFTQRVITVEDVGDIVVDTNSEIVFNAETEIELALGKVYAIIDRLDARRFRVRLPQAFCGVRGTKFVVEVGNDGTDIIIVLEGEVEFSDRENENSVIVGQNQMSTCGPAGVPTEPESINPDEIYRWWE